MNRRSCKASGTMELPPTDRSKEIVDHPNCGASGTTELPPTDRSKKIVDHPNCGWSWRTEGSAFKQLEGRLQIDQAVELVDRMICLQQIDPSEGRQWTN
ncbi:uncharacterized protein G2W53_001479 [Senna tora]|uniref:Uncharacterized protein n=1 Tax=Senna tora TaxID=362788 RepID=A0A835CJG7_9FABA|nr:uncharacterized protein G2W53_001479 [Senna tora]